MSSKRADGRPDTQQRELRISYEGLGRVDGSSSFAFGETKALASVSGPIEVRLAAELPSKATLEVFVRPLANVPGTESKALGAIIRSLIIPSLLLSQNPRTLIQLVLQSLTPNSSTQYQPTLVASLVNAATLALINSGSVPMRGVVCAVAIGRKSDGKSVRLLVDPSEGELGVLEGGGYFAWLFVNGGCELVSSSWQATNVFDEGELLKARELAKVAAGEIWEKIKETVGTMGLPSAAEPWKDAARGAVETKEGEDSGDDDKMS